jgi:hypothetical protein
MTAPAIVIRGMFPAPKPCPKPSLGAWIGFQIESSAVLDLEAAEVRGFQGLIRSIPADPSQPSEQDTSEAFRVALTTAPDAANPHPGGDVGLIKDILDARIAALGVQPRRTFTIALAGGGIGVSFEPLTFEPTFTDLQQIIGIVNLRAQQQNVAGAYGVVSTFTANGVAY